jgi:biotin transport system substrate-specific component
MGCYTKSRYMKSGLHDQGAQPHMTTFVSNTSPLIDRIWTEGQRGWLRNTVLAVVGAGLLTVSAKISVPFYPVPMTLQSLAVLLIGAAYGWRLGAATVLLYLFQGLMGMPVFAGTPPAIANYLYFVGPTGGFLIGFVASAAIVGLAVERGATRSPVMLAGTMLLAQIVLYALGSAWLAYFAQLSTGATGTGVVRAWAAAQNYLLGDVLKTAVATALTLAFVQKTAR